MSSEDLKGPDKQSSDAYDRYYKNPKYCEHCKNVIQVKHSPSWTRQRRFCGYKCSAAVYAIRREERKGRLLIDRTLGELTTSRHKERISRDNSTLKYARQNWKDARVQIRNHAMRTFKKSGLPFICVVCGYSKHAEVCHKKDVLEFPDEATIGEINSIKNMVALCPNHHWEFDNGKMSDEDLLKIPNA